jgi:tetratricopeptide (TPR) repeat protein
MVREEQEITVDYSMSRQATLICQVCGCEFSAQFWLIIDVPTRRDLVTLAAKGELHQCRCPNDHICAVDAPLLLYQLTADYPVIYVPTAQADEEDNWKQANSLISELRDLLGTAWSNDWIAQGLPRIEHNDLMEMLGRFVDDEPQADERPPEDEDDYILLWAFPKFYKPLTWVETRAQLDEYPVLLTPHALELLAVLVDYSREGDSTQFTALLDLHHQLLIRCANIGIDQAFAELEIPLPTNLFPTITFADVDHSSVEEIRQLAEYTIQLLRAAGMKASHLDSLSQEVKRCLQATDISAKMPPAQCLRSLTKMLHQVGLSVLTGGSEASNRGLLPRAERMLMVAEQIARLGRDELFHAACLYNLGLLYKRKKDHNAAVRFYHQAIDLGRHVKNHQIVSAALDNLGNIHMEAGLPQLALEHYTKALEAARAAQDVAGELSVLNNMSEAHQQLGDLEQTKALLQQVLDRARTIDNKLAEAIALENLASIYLIFGLWNEAKEARLTAINLFEQQGAHYDQYVALCKMAHIYMLISEDQLAGHCFERAADLIHRLRSSVDIHRYTIGRQTTIANMEDRGLEELEHRRREIKKKLKEVYLRRRDRRLAGEDDPIQDEIDSLLIADLKQQRELAPKLNITFSMFSALEYQQAGTMAVTLHQYEQAELKLKAALALFRQVGARWEEASVLNDLSTLYHEMGNTQEARRLLLAAREIAHEVGDLRREVMVLVNLGVLSMESDDDAEALDAYTQAEVLLEAVPRVSAWLSASYAEKKPIDAGSDLDSIQFTKARILATNLGNLHMQNGSYQRAEQYYLQGVAAVEQKRSTPVELYQFVQNEAELQQALLVMKEGLLLNRLASLFQLYQVMGDEVKLQQILQRMQQVAQESSDPKGKLSAARIVGNYRWSTGDLAGALEQYMLAIQFSDELREQVPRGPRRIGFLETIAPPYPAAIVLATHLGRDVLAMDLLEGSKSRQMLDLLAEQVEPPVSGIDTLLLERERQLYEKLIQIGTIVEITVPEGLNRSYVRTMSEALEQLPQSRDDLHKIWGAIETINPEYVALRRGSALVFNDVRRLLTSV